MEWNPIGLLRPTADAPAKLATPPPGQDCRKQLRAAAERRPSQTAKAVLASRALAAGDSCRTGSKPLLYDGPDCQLSAFAPGRPSLPGL